MVRINLLPHREARRKERKTAFVAMLIAAVFVGGLLVLAVGGVIATRIAAQNERNAFIQAENAKLDVQIKEIATLKQEIEALKARQQAVEDLQSDRNQPVYLMDELVKQVPEGTYLRSFKQAGQKVTLNGYAQSNERVSELLRNLAMCRPGWSGPTWWKSARRPWVRARTCARHSNSPSTWASSAAVKRMRRPRWCRWPPQPNDPDVEKTTWQT